MKTFIKIIESTLSNTTGMWVLDPGKSDHMCEKLEWFYNYYLLFIRKYKTLDNR